MVLDNKSSQIPNYTFDGGEEKEIWETHRSYLENNTYI